MRERIKSFFGKNREFIIYILVGGGATAVNLLTVYLLKLVLNHQIVWQNLLINALGWVAAVAYAYPSNRAWVFRSKNPDILKELAGFVASRLATFVLDLALMALTVNVLRFPFWISKVVVSFLAFLTNYVLSKLLVFRNRHKAERKTK